MRLVLVGLLAGCAFHAHAAGGDDGSGAGTMLVDDSAADFAQGSNDDSVIDPLGTLEPQAYALGGFHARAYDGKHVSGTTQSWQQIETEVAGATLRGAAYEQLPANWMGGHPLNLGLDAAQMPDDNFTVIFEGEILVPAGDHMIDIDADDAGALEIDPDGTGFQMFTLDAAGGAQAIAFHANGAHWMPVHIAIGEGNGNSQLLVRLDGTALTPDATRARVSTDHGLLGWFYYGMSNMELVGGAVAVDSPNVNWGMAAPPYDVAGVPTSYEARLLGQLRIDEDGMYTLATSTASTDDSTARYIDRHLVSRTSIFTDSYPTAATLQLSAGWHAIAIDVGGTQKNILGTPDPHDVILTTTIARNGGAAMPVTADMVRPAAMSGYYAVALSPATPLNDTTMAGGVTMIGLPAPQPAPPRTALIESTNVGVIYKIATPSDYTISVDTGSGSFAIPSTGVVSFLSGDETAAGAAVPAMANQWTFTLTDSVPGSAAGKEAAAFAGFSMHGGPLRPFAPTWTYVSRPHAIAARAWGPMTVTGTLDGATLALSVRSATSADVLEATPWVDVVNGGVPTVMPSGYVQYRVTVVGDGWQFPTIDKVELDYTLE